MGAVGPRCCVPNSEEQVQLCSPGQLSWKRKHQCAIHRDREGLPRDAQALPADEKHQRPKTSSTVMAMLKKGAWGYGWRRGGVLWKRDIQSIKKRKDCMGE